MIADVEDDDQVGRVIPGSTPLHVELVSEFGDHRGEVWSVSWNLTGTILSSAGDDGKLRFWKQAYSGEFQCMSVVTAEQRLEDLPDLAS
jgi:nucleoporin SEH1